MKNKYYKNNLIFSICISGILISLILVFNFVFDLFKVWNWSIQMFLIIYAIGIYKINNVFVNVFFLLVVPPLLFAMETGAYVITPMQTFFEYFLSFYIFGLLYISRFIKNLLVRSKSIKGIYAIDFAVFSVSFCIILVLKFFMHSIASYVWYGQYVDYQFWPAMVYNGPWLATNTLTIPVVAVVTIPIFKLFDKYNKEQMNKW